MTEKPTRVLLGPAARKAIIRGVNAIYMPVRETLGPEGGNALLPRTYNRGNRITNDGVSIAKMIEPLNEFEQEAAHAFREASEKTNEKVGDGTTSTVVIGGHLINEVFAKLEGASSVIRTKSAGGKMGVMKLRREMREAMKAVLEEIKKRSVKIKSVEDLEKVATISVEDPELGKIVAKMAWDVGMEGFIDVTDGVKGDIETEVIKGMRIPAKIPGRAFMNRPDRFEMTMQDTPCIVTNFALDNPTAINDFTQHLTTSKLVLFAPSFSDGTLLSLIASIKQGFLIYPVAVPSLRTEQFEDLSVYVGATFINKDTGKKLEGIREADCGFLEKLVVKDTDAKEDATVIGGRGEKDGNVAMGEGNELKTKSAVQQRIEILKGQIEETKVELHKKLLEKRIASISAAVGIIRVGSSSQAESLYLKLKIEDAVYACKAALQEGYVKGGGLCLKEIAEALPESILTGALKAPYEQIQSNAEGSLEIGDEVIDPAKAVRLEVEHAVSVTSQMVTLKIIVAEPREKNPAEGYEAIARAIDLFTRLQGRQWGLIKENQDEIDADNAALHDKYNYEHGNG